MDDPGVPGGRGGDGPPEANRSQACPILLDFFRRRLPPHRADLAEDLSQETLLAMLWALESGKIERVVDTTAYALGIARRKFSDLLRADYKRRRTPNESRRVADSTAPALDRDVEEEVLHAEWRHRLHRALRRLNRDEREMLLLRFFLDLDHREACGHLGMSSSQGSRLKYRAIEKLRFELRAGKDGPR